MRIIVGLGNPGDKYTAVRHNLGFTIVDEFRHKHNLGKWQNEAKFKSEIVKTDNLVLARPQTYMNNSGMGVKLLADYYKIPHEDVILIYDDLDLPLGKIKVRLGGAAAGHHGVESVIEHLGTDEFIRIRLGIGNLRTQSAEHKGQHVNAEKFVLEPFLQKEKSQVKHMVKKALDALQVLLEKGLEYAQSQYNS